MPNVPGADKIELVESGAPGDAAAMDKFGQALSRQRLHPADLRGQGSAVGPGTPGKVSAVVSLKSANPQAGDFSFPMEFILTDNTWQLARRTADELLHPDADARTGTHADAPLR